MSIRDDQLHAKYGVRRNQSEAAYRMIRDAIISGRIEQGAPLNEHSLAEEHGLSRTPVRYALTRLASDGLAEQVPHVGTFVRKLGIDETLQLVGFRRGMESAAAAMAAARATAADVAELRELASEVARLDDEVDRASDAAVEKDALWANREAEFTFHRRVVELTENPEMVRVANNAIGVYLTLCSGVIHMRDYQNLSDRPVVTHLDVVEAIASGEAPRGFGAMWNHFETLIGWLKLKRPGTGEGTVQQAHLDTGK